MHRKRLTMHDVSEPAPRFQRVASRGLARVALRPLIDRDDSVSFGKSVNLPTPNICARGFSRFLSCPPSAEAPLTILQWRLIAIQSDLPSFDYLERHSLPDVHHHPRNAESESAEAVMLIALIQATRSANN